MGLPLPLIASIVAACLIVGYFVYGRFLARQFKLRDDVRTPAHEFEDGEDHVPTPRFYLLGQHLSAIAAAGPIVGPIAAAQQFGWLPAILWITFGVILIGAVHDFTALVASVRHRARSIAEIVREHVGPRAWGAMLAFIWIALVYVILAFTDTTAGTFVGISEELEGLDGGTIAFNKGGAVAAAAVMYLLLAVVMGLVQRKWKLPLWLVTAVFVPATLGVIWLGTQVSTALVFDQATWGGLILVYCFAASLIPVWMLLQPRGYLGGFVLYGVLAIGVYGVFFGGYEIQMPATTAAPTAGFEGSLFPFLFVTIACGACSGFHGLVCSGTTSKQIDKESHCTSVGYGAMLLEGLVALVALSTVMILTPAQLKAGGKPGALYGAGIAEFLSLIVGRDHLRFCQVFGTMAFSTFVFDTLDVATRLGRYILQELTGVQGRVGAAVATAATVGVPAVLLFLTGPGSFATFWTLFGTSNQLLAALTLLGISVWLRRTGRPCWFTVLLMLFIMTITVWSIIGQTMTFWAKRDQGGANVANAVVGVVLLSLAAFFAIESARALLKPREATA
ncbi:MAG: carbon starvation protein A [Planctomycetes bacterium]|nr:carbon starvation protein A [Planctomycetota bacterium]